VSKTAAGSARLLGNCTHLFFGPVSSEARETLTSTGALQKLEFHSGAE